LGSLEKAIEKDIKLIIIDSIQTIYDESIDQSSGGVSQIKSCGYKIGEIAKRNAIPIIVTGHITKQGRIAGPKTLEHLVDGVFYLEGDSNYDQRILKSIKNRYGSTGEVGIFKMSQKGLEQVANPSSLFLSQASFGDIFGGVTASIMEGQRPLLIEVQALAERTVFGYPKRRAQGISSNRLELLSAVISNKTNLNLSDKDIYVNIVGGMSVDEPSIDLPICLAIVSALRKKPINKKIVCFGEVGLSGEIRPVSDIPSRLKEAKRLGYKKAIIAKSKDKNYRSKSLDITPAGTLKEAIELAF
jgi:DNA repair protein RadA/Sms